MREDYNSITNTYTVIKDKGKNKKAIEYTPYLFEIDYLKPQIKRLISNLSNLKFKLNRLNQRLETLKNKEIRSIFGSKDLFKKQFTLDKYKNNQQKWKEDFYNQRFKSLMVAGRKDSKQGNFVFRYDGNKLKMKGFEKGKKTEIVINNVDFSYRKDDLITALNLPKDQRKAIAWQIEDRGDYFLIKAMFTPQINKDEFNYSKVNGVVGIDINVDHITFAEIDSKGNLLDNGTIPMKLDYSTGRNAKIIEDIAIKIMKICKEKKKPLVMENLDLKVSKRKLLYGDNETNRKISSFTYKKIETAIKSRANKDKIKVYEVNPAYTSMFGKLKYMKAKGLSIHVSASYCIARRGMDFQERLPKEYKDLTTAKTYTGKNRQIFRATKVNPYIFYKNLDFTDIKNHKELKDYLKEIA